MLRKVWSDFTMSAHMQLHKSFPLIILYLSIMWFPCGSTADIKQIGVVVTDPAPYHVHPPGQHFKISVEIKSQPDIKVMYSWKDFRGNTLTKPVQLIIGQPHEILSPSTQIGYYELVLKTVNGIHSLPNREPGEEKGYGFAILPQPLLSERSPNLKSNFGVVHADIADPYLPTWVKTLTWNTMSTKWWGHKADKQRSRGKLELPIISSSDWDWDDSIPISQPQLDKLQARVKSYFSASPSIVYWETGIEENIKPQYQEQYYWKNLESKLKAVRSAANEVNPKIKLIYQIAGLKQKYVKSFAESRASRLIDILSIHPYAWPNFPSPETWHDDYVLKARQQLKAHDLNLPIWYTEVGATHHGNVAGSFFGYPKKNTSVTGLTRYQAINYLIKLHVMAFHAGIEKVFWYNYQDREPEREYAENHFGLRDFSGYPKPVYVAYTNLHRLLANKTADKKRYLPGNIRVYEFSDKNTKILVLWSFPASSPGKTVSLDSLITGLPQHNSIDVVDFMGRILPFFGDTITITGEPLFLITRQN